MTVKTLNIQQQSTLVLEVITTDSSSISLHWEVDGATAGSSSTSAASSSSTGTSENEPGDFVLHISEEGSGQWFERRLARHLRKHTETNLKCGTKYLIYMTYRDKSTTGEIITARTKGTVAMAPAAEEFIFSNSTAVALNFNAWHNGGCPIKNFSIKYRHATQKHWKVLGTVKYELEAGYLQQRPFLITNLDPNADYVLSVAATSNAGMFQALDGL